MNVCLQYDNYSAYYASIMFDAFRYLLCSKLCRQHNRLVPNLWAVGTLLKESGFLFLLHLRDPAVQQMKSLDCLVLHFYKYYKEAKQNDFSCITQDGGKSVTILLDGYDEFPADLRQNSFVSDLLQRKVFPASAIVISSILMYQHVFTTISLSE